MTSVFPIPHQQARPTKVQSKILDPNGKPVSYFLYPSPRHNLRAYKPRYFLSPDTKSNVSEYDRWEMVNYARQLFAHLHLQT